jgi:hypothetical protein
MEAIFGEAKTKLREKFYKDYENIFRARVERINPHRKKAKRDLY